MKFIVDKEKCIGCGICLAHASSVFDIDDDGLAFVKKTLTSESPKTLQQAMKAMKACPTQAIKQLRNK